MTYKSGSGLVERSHSVDQHLIRLIPDLQMLPRFFLFRMKIVIIVTKRTDKRITMKLSFLRRAS